MLQRVDQGSDTIACFMSGIGEACLNQPSLVLYCPDCESAAPACALCAVALDGKGLVTCSCGGNDMEARII